MNVLGANTNSYSTTVSIYFGESLEDYIIDPPNSRCFSDRISDWLETLGIDRGTYIMRDVFSNHQGFSYTVIEFDSAEAVLMLKLAYNEYQRYTPKKSEFAE